MASNFDKKILTCIIDKGKTIICLCAILLLSNHCLIANEVLDKFVSINVTDYDFGLIPPKDSLISTTFELTNVSNEPIKITSVTQDCRCLDIKWDKNYIPPKAKGNITVSYHRTGEYAPFHRTIGVHLSCSNDILHIYVHGCETLSRSELKKKFPYHVKGIGFPSKKQGMGYIPSNVNYEALVPICNYTNSELYVNLMTHSKDLRLSVSPNPIPACSVAEINYEYFSSKEPKSLSIPYHLIINKKGRLKRSRRFMFSGNVIKTTPETDIMPVVKSGYNLGDIKTGQVFGITIKKEVPGTLSIFKIEAPDNYKLLLPLPTVIVSDSITIPLRITPFFSLKKKHSNEIIIYTDSEQAPILRIKTSYTVSVIQTLKYYFTKKKGTLKGAFFCNHRLMFFSDTEAIRYLL